VTTSTPHTANVSADSGLPDFANPPVDEVVLSVEFAALPGFGVPHFGLFWERIRSEYPKFEVKPPLSSPGDQFAPNQVSLQLLATPEVRCWFLEESGSYLLQLQNDRLLLNWRKVVGTETYPRYPMLRDRFERAWIAFLDFLSAEGIPSPRVVQCEVLYVNNIAYDKGWKGFGELHKVVGTLATPQHGRFLPAPERTTMQMAYALENNAGRLFVTLTPVIRSRDSAEVLQIRLNARGAPKSSESNDLLQWLDLGRRWVVRGFADFTTENMHKVWGKK
jgi:uncharacterized protein (TIGR04255 family)